MTRTRRRLGLLALTVILGLSVAKLIAIARSEDYPFLDRAKRVGETWSTFLEDMPKTRTRNYRIHTSPSAYIAEAQTELLKDGWTDEGEQSGVHTFYRYRGAEFPEGQISISRGRPWTNSVSVIYFKEVSPNGSAIRDFFKRAFPSLFN